VAVEVFAADEQNDHPVDTLRWVHLAEAVLGEEGLSGDAELSVLFVDEPAIAELNSRFLGKEGPTDVLAFPIDEEPVESGRSPDSGGTGPGMPSEPEDVPVLLGDIVICPAVAFRNAPSTPATMTTKLPCSSSTACSTSWDGPPGGRRGRGNGGERARAP